MLNDAVDGVLPQLSAVDDQHQFAVDGDSENKYYFILA